MRTLPSTLHGRRFRTALVALTLVALGVMASAAKCIERTSTYVDSDGYTHITGEMVNDTDIQATQMMLQGTLYDAADGVVAQKVAPTCPPDTQPHQQTVFDIRFDNPNVPPWTRYDVRPLSGKTLTSPLPEPKVVLFFAEAIRLTQPIQLPGLKISDKDVFLAFDVRNQSDNVYAGVQGCTAVLDQAGNVVFVSTDEILQKNADGSYQPAVMRPQARGSVFLVAANVPKGPVQVRAWLWFGSKGAPTSQYQFVSTGLITIQPRATFP